MSGVPSEVVPKPTISEDALDPLLATAPPSPTIPYSTIVNPDAVDEVVEEAVTSAQAKQLKRAADFRERFYRAQGELSQKGVLVAKFGEVAEIEEQVRSLVFGEQGGK